MIFVLPFVAVILFLARRRNTVIGIGLSLAATGIVVLIGLKTARGGVVGLIENELSRRRLGSGHGWPP